MLCYPSPDAAVADVLRLSSAMTWKMALADVPYGGGKAVIALPQSFDTNLRQGLLYRYGEMIASLRGLFVTGPDMGTTPADMDIIAQTGAPHIHSRTVQAGGAGDSGPGTAIGVMAGIRTTAARLGLAMVGLRVLVMGAGGVGGPLIGLLQEAGAAVSFCDVDPEVTTRFAELRCVASDDVYHSECDIFAPCAMGGVLNADTIPQLGCRAVVGSANNQLAQEKDAQRLRERGIIYAPDMVVSIGGFLSVMGVEQFGRSREQAHEQISDRVTQTLSEVYEIAESEEVDTHTAALSLARKRLGE